MSQSVKITESSHDYTATVQNEGDLDSAVVVTSGKYTVRFDGNGFASKHLRRIRRQSVSELQGTKIDGKLKQYMAESQGKALERFSGNQNATSTFIFLDLGQYCQFGCQVIKFLASNTGAWTQFGNGNNACLQKHCEVTIEKCFASSNSGFGPVKQNQQDQEKLEHGIGITLRVTVKQPLNGTGFNVQVCHYAGGEVEKGFTPQTVKHSTQKQLKNIGLSVVT